MWAELPDHGLKAGRRLILCLGCGSSTIIGTSVHRWKEYGCQSCMAQPTGAYAGTTKYMSPTRSLLGWDYKTPIEELLSKGRIIRCGCNTCKDSLLVQEAA